MHVSRLGITGALCLGLAALSGLAGARAEAERGPTPNTEPARHEAPHTGPVRRETRFEGWTPLSDYVVAGLGEGGSFRLTVPTRAGNVELALHPVPVEAAGYSAEETGPGHQRRGRGRPLVRTFGGSVRGGAGPEPAGAKPQRGGDFARLALEPGGRVSGLLRLDGVLYDLAADAAAGDLVLHVREVPADEIAPVLSSCAAVADGPPDAASAAPSAEAAGTTLREIELGTEADAPFVAQLGGVAAANARILSIVNAINGIYETDLGLTNRVVFQRGWNGNDPYTSSDSGTLLDEFWNDFLGGVSTPTDDAQLFSGRDFENSTVGRASVSSTCTSYRFGVNQYYQQNDSITRLIAAHEMGHNLGGSHTSDGIMAATIDPNVTWFSATSQTQIASYVSSVTCLAPATSGGAPVLEPIGPQSVRENDTLKLQLSASDPDGDPLVYAATPLPSGATLSSSGAFQWRPPLDSVGCGGFVERPITFSVSDPDGNRATETVVISVLDAPSGAAPRLDAPADRSVVPRQTLSIPLHAVDADGDSVTYGATALPAGASLSTDGVFSWTPDASELGPHALTFTATDCTGRRASQKVEIDVVTDAPVLGALSSASGDKGDVLTLTGQNLAGRKVKVFFGPKKRKAKNVTDTSLVVKVPKKKKGAPDEVQVTVWRDGVVSTNTLTFTYTTPTP